LVQYIVLTLIWTIDEMQVNNWDVIICKR
jgi:hypothetical protein